MVAAASWGGARGPKQNALIMFHPFQRDTPDMTGQRPQAVSGGSPGHFLMSTAGHPGWYMPAYTSDKAAKVESTCKHSAHPPGAAPHTGIPDKKEDPAGRLDSAPGAITLRARDTGQGRLAAGDRNMVREDRKAPENNLEKPSVSAGKKQPETKTNTVQIKRQHRQLTSTWVPREGSAAPGPAPQRETPIPRNM